MAQNLQADVKERADAASPWFGGEAEGLRLCYMKLHSLGNSTKTFLFFFLKERKTSSSLGSYWANSEGTFSALFHGEQMVAWNFFVINNPLPGVAKRSAEPRLTIDQL